MSIPYIPYFTTSRYRVQAMIDLADIKPGEKAADLGTGDGRIAIALTQAGALVDAYELDDEMIKLAQKNKKEAFSPVILNESEGSQSINVIPAFTLEEKAGIQLNRSFEQVSESRSRISYTVNKSGITSKPITPPIVLKKDFWCEDLSKYSIICCYPMPTIMGRLEKKLKDELQPGSRVLLNYFPFKHWKLAETKDNIFLYKK